MATKVTETVTPNPLSPEQTAFNQGSIDAETYRNDLVRQLSPLLVDLMKTGGADSDFITQTLRGAGVASDQALALAQGVPYDPTGSQPAIAALYRQELGREPDQGNQGYAGKGYGAGGSGAVSTGTAVAGGAGTAGICIVEEYY